MTSYLLIFHLEWGYKFFGLDLVSIANHEITYSLAALSPDKDGKNMVHHYEINYIIRVQTIHNKFYLLLRYTFKIYLMWAYSTQRWTTTAILVFFYERSYDVGWTEF